MSSNVKIVLNREGVRSLLCSKETEAMVKGYADQIASRAAGTYVVDTHTGPNRVNAQVSTKDKAAVKANLSGNDLLKAMG